MSTEKRLEKIKRLTKDGGEPNIEPFDYKITLMLYLNYHNTNTSDKDKRVWAERYLRDKHPGAIIPNVHDREFRSLGVIARLTFIDSYIDAEEERFLAEECTRILGLVVTNTNDEDDKDLDPDKKSRSELIEQTIAIKTSEFIGELEGLIDDYITTGTAQSVTGLISSLGVTSRMFGKISEYATQKSDYYTGVMKDKEAMDAYNLPKAVLKKIVALYASVPDVLSQNKKIRKPRATKERPAGVVVKDLKFKAVDEALNLKSVTVTNLIGATEVYLFRADSRKLQYFKALDGQTITVKGTTLMNYDESKSYQKTIRKPELLTEVQGKGKMDTRRFIKDIKSTEASLSGRTNDETIILATFK